MTLLLVAKRVLRNMWYGDGGNLLGKIADYDLYF
jgi:hypothetical protein